MRASVNTDLGLLELSFPFSFGTKERVKALPGARWSKARRKWNLPATPASAVNVSSEFSAIEGDALFEELLDAGLQRAQAQALKTEVELPYYDDATEPWLHQKQAFWYIAALWGGLPGEPGEYLTSTSRAAACFFEMGAGKTKVAIDLIVNFGFWKTLVLAPKCVLPVWPTQFRRHASRPVDCLVLDGGSTAERATELRLFLETADRPTAVVVNYEAAWRGALHDLLMAIGWDCLVTDEHHRLKSPQGRASTFAYKLSQKIPYKLALTGTPLPHSPLDAFATYRCLDAGIFGTSFTKFREHYAVMSKTTPSFPVGYQNLDELHDRMYQIAIRVTKEEALDLPDIVHVEIPCMLGQTATKAYAELEEDLYTQLESGEVTAANALVKLLRLRQLTSGFLKEDDGMTVRVDDSKENVLADTLSDLPADEPIVVFAVFRNDLEEWQSGKADVLGVQIKAGGVGIDLTRARYGIYYSIGFELSEFEQSLARLHRPGQAHKVTFYHLIAKDTVDVRVYEALRERKDVVETVLATIREQAA